MYYRYEPLPQPIVRGGQHATYCTLDMQRLRPLFLIQPSDIETHCHMYVHQLVTFRRLLERSRLQEKSEQYMEKQNLALQSCV